MALKWERRPFTMDGSIEIWAAQGEMVSLNAMLVKAKKEWRVTASVNGIVVGYKALSGSVLDAQVAARMLVREYTESVLRDMR